MISEHLAGVNAGVLTRSCGVRHCRYPYFTNPQVVFSPQEVRNVTAACSASSRHLKRVLEMPHHHADGTCTSGGAWLRVHERWGVASRARAMENSFAQWDFLHWRAVGCCWEVYVRPTGEGRKTPCVQPLQSSLCQMTQPSQEGQKERFVLPFERL